jgi:gluconate 2-dehydrogenase gamma chain
MQAMEKDEISSDLWTVSPKQFFNILLARTMQGFYGSPRHGGNKDYASYRMLKLEYPLLIGQNRYLKN